MSDGFDHCDGGGFTKRTRGQPEAKEMENVMDTLNNTPETDKALLAVKHGTDRFSFPEHARRMERERDAARLECHILRSELLRLYDVVASVARMIIADVLNTTTDFKIDKSGLTGPV